MALSLDDLVKDGRLERVFCKHSRDGIPSRKESKDGEPTFFVGTERAGRRRGRSRTRQKRFPVADVCIMMRARWRIGILAEPSHLSPGTPSRLPQSSSLKDVCLQAELRKAVRLQTVVCQPVQNEMDLGPEGPVRILARRESAACGRKFELFGSWVMNRTRRLVLREDRYGVSPCKQAGADIASRTPVYRP